MYPLYSWRTRRKFRNHGKQFLAYKDLTLNRACMAELAAGSLHVLENTRGVGSIPGSDTDINSISQSDTYPINTVWNHSLIARYIEIYVTTYSHMCRAPMTKTWLETMKTDTYIDGCCALCVCRLWRLCARTSRLAYGSCPQRHTRTVICNM